MPIGIPFLQPQSSAVDDSLRVTGKENAHEQQSELQIALGAGQQSPNKLKQDRMPAAVQALDNTIRAIYKYLATPSDENRSAAIALKENLIRLKTQDERDGFAWKPSASKQTAIEYKVSLLFDDQKGPGTHGDSLLTRLYANSRKPDKGLNLGERGQSSNVDNLKETIRAFDKGQATPEQLRKSLNNVNDAFERRFIYSAEGWTKGLIESYDSFRKQAERRLQSKPTQTQSHNHDSRGLGIVGPRFQKQVTFERQFEGMGILTPRIPPLGQPFYLSKVSEVKAEPIKYFESGVVNRDFLSVKPLSTAERRELYQRET